MRVPPYSTSPTGIASGLSFPGGFAAGPGGTIYVSNWSVIADPGSGTGELRRDTNDLPGARLHRAQRVHPIMRYRVMGWI
jgi:hypothetical protein